MLITALLLVASICNCLAQPSFNWVGIWRADDDNKLYICFDESIGKLYGRVARVDNQFGGQFEGYLQNGSVEGFYFEAGNLFGAFEFVPTVEHFFTAIFYPTASNLEPPARIWNVERINTQPGDSCPSRRNFFVQVTKKREDFKGCIHILY